MNNRLSQLSLDRNGDREHLSDIESQTDPDGGQSEADKEVIRQIFDISRALETFDDYKEIKEWINQDTTLFVYSQKDKILSIIETNLKQSKSVNIVVTQPRRIAARSLCEHISISRNWPVGQTVGYQTSLNKQRSTIDVEKLAHFFHQVINGQILLVYQFNVDDRLFDVQEMYLEHIQNYGLITRLSREAINLAVNLIKSFDNEDSMAGWDHTKNLPIKRTTVLVFLLGLLEIQTVYETLRFPRGKPDSV
ncbi:unnamed protein product [Rotaria sp. Silwood1]|nr:unnamed protein product [Rotaria sp. Silwood1]